MNTIGICASLEVFLNSNNLKVVVEKDEHGKYGVVFQREPDRAIFYSWPPFTDDFEEVRESVRMVLTNFVYRNGVLAYFVEGTFFFERYNLEGEVREKEDVLSLADIDRICLEIQEPVYMVEHLLPEDVERQKTVLLRDIAHVCA